MPKIPSITWRETWRTDSGMPPHAPSLARRLFADCSHISRQSVSIRVLMGLERPQASEGFRAMPERVLAAPAWFLEAFLQPSDLPRRLLWEQVVASSILAAPTINVARVRLRISLRDRRSARPKGLDRAPHPSLTPRSRGARAILDADRNLYAGRHVGMLRQIFSARGIGPAR